VGKGQDLRNTVFTHRKKKLLLNLWKLSHHDLLQKLIASGVSSSSLPSIQNWNIYRILILSASGKSHNFGLFSTFFTCSLLLCSPFLIKFINIMVFLMVPALIHTLPLTPTATSKATISPSCFKNELPDLK